MKPWKIAALLAVLVVAAGCSGNPRVSEPAQQAQPPMPTEVTISSVEHASSDGSTRITLHGNFPFSYTSYEPDYSTLVLELLDVDATPISGVTPVNSSEIESMETSVRGEALQGSRVSQVSIHFKRPTTHELKMAGNDLILEFRPDSTRPAFPGTLAEAEQGTGPATPGSGLQLLPEASAGSTLEEQAALDKAKPATVLLAVVPRGPDAHRSVKLKADGRVTYKLFELKNPDRLVIDMQGVQNRVPSAQRSLQPDSGFLQRIRVAQFATAPEKVARVVFDLKAPRPYVVHPAPDGITVDFSDAVTARKSEPPPEAPSTAKVSTMSSESVPGPEEETAAPAQASTLETAEGAKAGPTHPPTDEEPAQLGVNLAAETPQGASP